MKTYEVINSKGAYVTWYRDAKVAKMHASKIGGTVVTKKTEAAATAKPWSGPLLRNDDGTVVPFTKANLKAAR